MEHHAITRVQVHTLASVCRGGRETIVKQANLLHVFYFYSITHIFVRTFETKNMVLQTLVLIWQVFI